jgi:hypothetical protein
MADIRAMLAKSSHMQADSTSGRAVFALEQIVD